MEQDSKCKLTHWHRTCVRMRLNSYKLINSLSWLQVAENIILSKTNDYTFPELSESEELALDARHHSFSEKSHKIRQDVGWPIQAQDLRRFVDGDKKNQNTGKREPRNTSEEKLIPICNFLIDESYLPLNFFEIHNESQFYSTIYSLIAYLGISYESNSPEKWIDLTGDYKNSEKDNRLLISTAFAFLASPDNLFYEIRQQIYTHQPPQRKPQSIELFSGWGIPTDGTTSSLLILLKNSTEIDDPTIEKRKVFSITGIKSLKGVPKSIALNRLAGLHFMALEDDIRDSGKSFKPMTLNRFYENACPENKANDKVVSIGSVRKEKPKTFSFGRESTAADKWKSFKNMETIGKEQGLEDSNTTEKFFRAAYKGSDLEVEEYVNAGGDVNYKNPQTGIRALHLIACSSAVYALEALQKSPDLEYLVVDAKGHLPSHYAWVSANNPVMGKYLQKMEMKEAKAKGIDYESLIKNRSLD